MRNKADKISVTSDTTLFLRPIIVRVSPYESRAPHDIASS